MFFYKNTLIEYTSGELFPSLERACCEIILSKVTEYRDVALR